MKGTYCNSDPISAPDKNFNPDTYMPGLIKTDCI